MAYARRVDATHGAVHEALMKMGWDVIDTSRLPCFVDLVCWHRGRQVLQLVEVKTAKGTLTTSQQWLIDRGWPIRVVRTVQEAVNL